MFDINDTIISGGCKGVDTWAIERAKERGMKTKEFLPNLKDCKHRGEFTQAYYNRNEQIVKASDIIVAFVMPDRKGGTENTIKWAKEYGKFIYIVMEDDDNAKNKSKIS
ncbi:MAG: YpsA SLOG family protein [Candidatus Thorarchaeota archaeon]